jgi:RNA 3'-phosphate cyclase
MIEIDGSMLEGGGSVVRISVGLAALTGKPVRVFNIRAKRENPGLRDQHLEGIRAVSKLCNGRLEGDELGSQEIRFWPGEVKAGRIRVSIRTAGNVTLVLQPLMLAALRAGGEVEVEFEGGATDAPLAPPLDYLKHVTFPMLAKMGYRCEVECLRRGHYPKGGARATARLHPGRLKPLQALERGKVLEVHGISHCVRLPRSIAERQASEAKRRLLKEGYAAEVEVEAYDPEKDPHLAPGTGIVLWAECEGGVIGASALGRPGKPAEKVGAEAAGELLSQLRAGAAVDKHLTDQLIPYMALAGESEITSCEITLHTLTNLELVKRFLDVGVEVEGSLGEPGRVRIAKL